MTPAFSPPALEVEGLTVRYGARVAVEDVSLSVRPGELVAITGPNGAGKTTLLRSILGILSTARGTIRIQGTSLGSLSYRERARRMAWLPQDEAPQDNVTVLDYVLFGRYAHIPPLHSEESGDFAIAEEALRSMDLWSLRDSGIWEVSGGERQRVLLARALTQDAPLLVLDEPTSHLDVAHQLEMLERMRHWRGTAGRSVVAAMHDLNLAARFADRILVFSKGRLVRAGPPQEVLSPEVLRSVWGVDAVVRWDAPSGLPYLIPTLPVSSALAPASPGP
ncbi:MAG TPA: ABC transporter ATP-binding protein [Thermoplasmata archaeon]|nr:ABC transporter ATP-binding protein [Thermoplasmata archaeon]HEV2429517.1 ABC transporter ATP-binding protein [Thermoplasmata archaeon]